jgi:hypothetical protein
MGNHGHFMLLVLDANQEDIMNSVQQCFSSSFCGENFSNG